MPVPNRRQFLAHSAAATAAIAAGCAPAEPPKRPNLLLLVPDQLRFDWTEANPAVPVRTPNLTRLAARGTRFERAYCASPLCAPSRACLASGREYDRCGVPDNSLNYPLTQTTYYQLLRDAGYHVMGCGKFDLHKPEPSWGIEGQHLLSEWGFTAGIDSAGKWDAIRWGVEEPTDPYMHHLHVTNRVQTHSDDFERRRAIGTFLATFPTPLPAESYCDNWISAQALRLLDEAPAEKPWHLVVNWAGPHEPVDITGEMDEWYRDATFPQPNRNTEYPADKHVAIRRNYSAMIENLDQWVGKILEAVEARGELDNTIVMFTSDHGEMLGDHDHWMKRHPYEASAGVPLVAAGPGMTPGQNSDALVSVMDIAATFLDYAGLDIPREMDSRSFRRLLEGETDAHRDVLLSGINPWRAITDGEYKLFRGYNLDDPKVGGNNNPVYSADTDEVPPALFHLGDDPLENNNIAADAPDRVKKLSDALHDVISREA